jgi:hypothetical protein
VEIPRGSARELTVLHRPIESAAGCGHDEILPPAVVESTLCGSSYGSGYELLSHGEAHKICGAVESEHMHQVILVVLHRSNREMQLMRDLFHAPTLRDESQYFEGSRIGVISQLDRKVNVAPMMDWSDARYFR